MKDKKTAPASVYFIIFTLSLILLFYNIPFGFLGLLLCGICFWYDNQVEQKFNVRLQKSMEKIYKDVDKLNQERLYKIPIALAIIDEAGKIGWYNQHFDKNFRKGEDANNFFGKNIKDELAIAPEDLVKDKEKKYHFKNSEYTIMVNSFNDGADTLRLLHFFDITHQKKQQFLYQNNEPVFCYILVDNYDDIIEQLPSHERSGVLSQITLKINEWARTIGAFIMEYDNDHYLMIFEKEKLKSIEESRFRILDEIREIETGGKAQITLSIGIGVSDELLAIKDADELSHAALDIGLARGGDQAVVRHDEKMSFYGGTTEATEKRTKVKARVKAHGLRELIRDSDNVLIMGHQTPDMDCLGAAVGILGACEALGKPGKIIIKEINYSIKELFTYLVNSGNYPESFIHPKETDGYITPNTLLIVVDTQSANYLEVPELIEKVEQVVVIDHHRRSGEFIAKTVLNYTEAYASSTCELITELLQYMDEKVSMSETEANALMAGLCMDTKMFTFKTGVRTFEAASYLRRKGAETIIAKTMLQDDLETYSSRSEAVSNAKIYFDTIAISTLENESEYAKIIAAQAADELLNIKGINASFIILKADKGLIISGRSMGEVNVQLILEKLGGGGHLAMAGAQLPDLYDLEGGRSMLLEVIETYMKEREEK